MAIFSADRHAAAGEAELLRTVSFEIEGEDRQVVTPYVDGASLTALVEVYERAKGYDSGRCYGGLIPTHFDYGPLDQYFLGQAGSTYWRSLEKIYLLGCACGEVGCWPLAAQVYQNGDAISWSEFSQPFRPARNDREFGPFNFSRQQYEHAVKELSIRLDLDSADPGM